MLLLRYVLVLTFMPKTATIATLFFILQSLSPKLFLAIRSLFTARAPIGTLLSPAGMQFEYPLSLRPNLSRSNGLVQKIQFRLIVDEDDQISELESIPRERKKELFWHAEPLANFE